MRKDYFNHVIDNLKSLGNRFTFYFYATGIEKESRQFVRYPMHPNIDSCTKVILFTEKRDKFIRGKLVMTKSRRCKIDEVTANTLESELKKLPVKFEKATSNAKTYYKVTVENADIFDKPYGNYSPQKIYKKSTLPTV